VSDKLKVKQYHDMDGNKISLLHLVEQEPRWAVSRITELEKRPIEPRKQIADGLKHFMVNHYAGQFVPELTGPIIDLITEAYPDITFGEEDVNEILCVLHHICDRGGK